MSGYVAWRQPRCRWLVPGRDAMDKPLYASIQCSTPACRCLGTCLYMRASRFLVPPPPPLLSSCLRRICLRAGPTSRATVRRQRSEPTPQSGSSGRRARTHLTRTHAQPRCAHNLQQSALAVSR